MVSQIVMMVGTRRRRTVLGGPADTGSGARTATSVSVSHTKSCAQVRQIFLFFLLTLVAGPN